MRYKSSIGMYRVPYPKPIPIADESAMLGEVPPLAPFNRTPKKIMPKQRPENTTAGYQTVSLIGTPRCSSAPTPTSHRLSSLSHNLHRIPPNSSNPTFPFSIAPCYLLPHHHIAPPRPTEIRKLSAASERRLQHALSIPASEPQEFLHSPTGSGNAVSLNGYLVGSGWA